MNRRSFLSSTGALFAASGFVPRLLAANPGASPSTSLPEIPNLAPRFGDGRDWWFEKRFGMFVHWGLYAIHGWHEQEQWRQRIPRAKYEQLQKQWNPVKFNPDRWLDHAEAAGMKYVHVPSRKGKAKSGDSGRVMEDRPTR